MFLHGPTLQASSTCGRFLSRDTWAGEYDDPMSLNRWMYVEGNPVNYTDPSGKYPACGGGYGDCYISKCLSDPDLVGVDSDVQRDACGMIAELEMEGFLIDGDINSGYRSSSDAHRFSTAYHILHEDISLNDIMTTPVDQDGNRWWPENVFECIPEENDALKEILKTLVFYQASNNSPETQYGLVCTDYGCVPDVTFAYEGYEIGDPRRLPNKSNVHVSKHVKRLAVDIVDWKNTGDYIVWNPRVNTIARKYNLVSPFHPGNRDNYPEEFWHFEHP